MGEACNVAAIVMGDLVTKLPSLYSQDNLKDLSGINHARIMFNVTILKTKSDSHLSQIAVDVEQHSATIVHVAFSQLGTTFSNSFDQYCHAIQKAQFPNLIGIALAGEEKIVRSLTKKCSLL